MRDRRKEDSGGGSKLLRMGPTSPWSGAAAVSPPSIGGAPSCSTASGGASITGFAAFARFALSSSRGLQLLQGHLGHALAVVFVCLWRLGLDVSG
jgi:hypothetical protein